MLPRKLVFLSIIFFKEKKYCVTNIPLSAQMYVFNHMALLLVEHIYLVMCTDIIILLSCSELPVPNVEMTINISFPGDKNSVKKGPILLCLYASVNSRFLRLVSVWAARSFDQTALRPSVIKRIRQIDVKIHNTYHKLRCHCVNTSHCVNMHV